MLSNTTAPSSRMDHTNAARFDVDTTATWAAGGDIDALGALYDYFANKVTRFFMVKAHDTWLADDLSSETWTRVARSIGSFRVTPTTGFTAWLFTIARNVHIDSTRRRARRPEALRGDWLGVDCPAPDDTPERAAARSEVARLLADAVNDLPKQQARVIHLLLFAELTVPEACEVLGKTPGAVRKAQHDALKNLRRRLSGLDISAFLA